MANRSQDWNEGLAKDLKDPAFAQEFVMAMLEEEFSLQEALGKIIRTIGVKEYAEITGIASPNILRAIDPNHNPTQDTLNQLLKPLGLKLSVSPIVSAA